QLQINNALTSQGTSYNQIIAKTATRAEAEAEILRIIQQQVVAQRDLAGGVAASLYSKGLRFQNDNFTRAALFSAANFRPGSAAIRRAVSGAEGILPAVFDEAKAIEKGIG